MASTYDVTVDEAPPIVAIDMQHRTVASRDRSVSMNRLSETPPSKKQRSSDDECDIATQVLSSPPHTSDDASLNAPLGAPSLICVGQKASAASPQPWKETTSLHSSTTATTATTKVAVILAGINTSVAATGSPRPRLDAHTTNGDGDASFAAANSSSSSPSSNSSSASSTGSLASSASSSSSSKPFSSDVTDDSFMTWLLDQKEKGVGASQLLDVLGLGVSESNIAVDEDELWDAMLSMGIRLIQPTIASRRKLTHINTLQDVVELLQTTKKIVVLAGAGISVSCGIPDFRSENGIYSRLAQYNLPNPQCMFDIEFFRSNPWPFFAFAKELFPKANGFTFVPSRSHYFLKLLEDKGKLLRIYSQNIDMLEHAAGISHERSILCHGSFATATCLACKRVYPGDAIRDDVMKQQVPMCQACGAETGIVKPDVVFFGESLPRRFHDSMKTDEKEADLVLVMGSSLKVNPVRSIVGRIHPDAPMILINRQPVGRPHEFDVELLGYSDEIVEELCRQLGWELPGPDPELIGHSNLHLNEGQFTSEMVERPFEFVPPCRHIFNGATSTYSPSSSDDESSRNRSGFSSRSNSFWVGSSEEECDGNGVDVAMEKVDAEDDDRSAHCRRIEREEDEDEEDKGRENDDDEGDHLMGSGSELLRNSNLSTLDEDLIEDSRVQ